MSDFSRSLPRMASVAFFSMSLALSNLHAQTVTGGPAPVPPAAASAASPMEFDVVSVKHNSAENNMRRVMNKPGMFSATNVPLKLLIEQAYGIREDLISGGPGWIGSDSYDIEGKITPADAEALKAMTNEQRTAAQRLMMQRALADRFKLKVHVETKTLPVYELVLAKGGSKLKETDPTGANLISVVAPDGKKMPEGFGKNGMMRMEPGKLTGQAIAIAGITGFLSRTVERTVIDKTGLSGKYDFTLAWKSDDAPGGQDNGAADPNLPDLFTAIQEQLGLKLVSTKGPVDTLVIDSAEKPIEN
jgi:uncharacterized protein (TIGR03435 family)